MKHLNALRKIVILSLGLTILAGCQTASEHAADVRKARGDDEKISVGTVQRQIKVGMSSTEVVAALGSPNMVTTDSERRENWVYDKISTERVVSETNGSFSLLIADGGERTGASSTSQRTLTIIIKYDKNSMVRDFSYRYSSF